MVQSSYQYYCSNKGKGWTSFYLLYQYKYVQTKLLKGYFQKTSQKYSYKNYLKNNPQNITLNYLTDHNGIKWKHVIIYCFKRRQGIIHILVIGWGRAGVTKAQRTGIWRNTRIKNLAGGNAIRDGAAMNKPLREQRQSPAWRTSWGINIQTARNIDRLGWHVQIWRKRRADNPRTKSGYPMIHKQGRLRCKPNQHKQTLTS